MENQEKSKCKVCNKQDVELSLQPTRSSLLFGGFRVRFELRCNECEKDICKWVDKCIETNLGAPLAIKRH